MFESIKEEIEWYDEAVELFYALADLLPEGTWVDEGAIGVGEISIALDSVADAYEDLKMIPDAALMARLHVLNEKYPFVSMVAVEDRLKAIS